MKKINILTEVKISVITAVIFITAGCNQEWDSHYKVEQTNSKQVNLVDEIKAQPDLSIFSEMLHISGYDTILNNNLVFTVWAPSNNALENVDLNDIQTVKDIVQNHISKQFINTSLLLKGSLNVLVVNGKSVKFSASGGSVSFGNLNVTHYDIVAKNGLIHKTDGYLPYTCNLYEYVQRYPGFDSVYHYFNSFWDSTLDASNSFDSVYIKTNILFNYIGFLNRETTNPDSTYTMLLPNNDAWSKTYAKIEPYYKSAHKSLATQIQRNVALYMMVKDIVFPKTIPDPFSLDSMVSNVGDIIKSPGYLFENTSIYNGSNGIIYITDTLRFKNSDSYVPKILVQAENSTGRTTGNASIYTRYYFGNKYSVSRNRYITVVPTTTSSISKVYAEFSIPNTLASKYNIYCVFVPTSIEDTADHRPNRALFYLTYLNSSKKQVIQQLTVTNNTTTPDQVTKMLIASNFVFPYSHISSDEDPAEVVKIRVQTDVKAGATYEATANRTMLIDCLILEPINE